jgi:broad specificity phosphatase PhoE
VTGTRRLVLLRHGRTAWNLEERAQGHADVPLDAVGHAEAEAAAPYLARMGAVRLWSSDLRRAAQTASYVAAATGLEIGFDSRLREKDLGERSGLTRPEFADRFPEEHAAWVAGLEEPRVPGTESVAEMVARVAPALEDCRAALAPGETGIVVLHGWCARAAIFALLGWPPELDGTVRSMDNCGWSILGESPVTGALRLESYNETASPGPHLADFASDAPVG